MKNSSIEDTLWLWLGEGRGMYVEVAFVASCEIHDNGDSGILVRKILKERVEF